MDGYINFIIFQESSQMMENLFNCRYVGEFDRLDMVGQGTYGVVYVAKDKVSNQTYAIKKMRVLDQNDGFPITSLRQIKILKKLLKHPNVVNLHDVVVGRKSDSIFLVFQYCDIDLGKLVEQMYIDKISFNESEIKCLILQLLKGMNYAHEKYIIHRDLKLSNLLLNKNGILKIADFGLAREIEIPLKPITRKVVTLWYRAPQLLMKYKQYGTSVDVWSIGCILAELLMRGQPLFKGKNQHQQFQLICELIGYPTKDIWPDFFTEAKKEQRKQFEKCSVYRKNNVKQNFEELSGSKNCSDLFSKILCWDPQQRISISEMLAHPYFSESPRPVFPDELKILTRIDFYAKRSIEDINRRRGK